MYDTKTNHVRFAALSPFFLFLLVESLRAIEMLLHTGTHTHEDTAKQTKSFSFTVAKLNRIGGNGLRLLYFLGNTFFFTFTFAVFRVVHMRTHIHTHTHTSAYTAAAAGLRVLLRVRTSSSFFLLSLRPGREAAQPQNCDCDKDHKRKQSTCKFALPVFPFCRTPSCSGRRVLLFSFSFFASPRHVDAHVHTRRIGSYARAKAAPHPHVFV